MTARPLPDDAHAAGCRWPVTVEVPVDPAWPSGVYLVRCRATPDAPPDPITGAFVVRATAPSPERVLLVLATTTWNAYNDLGGPNLYTGATALSFERPFAPGMLAKPTGAGDRLATLAAGTGSDAYIAFTATHQLSMWHGMAGWSNQERRFALRAGRSTSPPARTCTPIRGASTATGSC
jgi:hypothetical protein